VHLVPGPARGVDDLVPQQQLGQPMPGPRPILPGRLAGADQIVSDSGHPGAPGMAFNFLPIDGSA